MNKESRKIIEFIDSDDLTTEKLEEIKKRFTNSRDFTNQIGYLVMEIVNTNQEFYQLNRNKLEIEKISERYFG
jgi:hypothetical protein